MSHWLCALQVSFAHHPSHPCCEMPHCLSGLQVSGDPRRPNDVQGYEPPIPFEPAGDIMMLGGMAAALLGLILKVCSHIRDQSQASTRPL